MKLDRQFFERMGALEAGVIFPDCEIAEELENMAPENARKAKRKWRKLVRKTTKKHRREKDMTYDQGLSKRAKKYNARRVLVDTAKEMLNKEAK